MWSRADLKRKGKIAFRANYGVSVAISILLFVTLQGVTFTTLSLSDDQLETIFNYMNLTMLGQLFRAALSGYLLTLIVSIFVLAPLQVGCRRFFILNGRAPARLSECLYGFKNCYWNVVMTMFLKNLYQFFWSLLFLIPGFIKGYSYRLVPYILAEHPDLGANEVITRSRELMNGNKLDAFVLDLSFLGWELLSACTLDILGLVYVYPYKFSTDAELYRVLSADGADGAGGSGAWRGPRGDENGPYDEPDPHPEY